MNAGTFVVDVIKEHQNFGDSLLRLVWPEGKKQGVQEKAAFQGALSCKACGGAAGREQSAAQARSQSRPPGHPPANPLPAHPTGGFPLGGTRNPAKTHERDVL